VKEAKQRFGNLSNVAQRLGNFTLLNSIRDPLFSFVIVDRENSDWRPDSIRKNTGTIGLMQRIHDQAHATQNI
jgi:hypothetical protein